MSMNGSKVLWKHKKGLGKLLMRVIEQHNLGLASAKKRMAQLLFYFSAKVITFTPFPLVAVVMDIASKA
ncbi:uncharacterized protein LAJ45_08066 [Morchella importuna]|uniref:uncharacterized protein n=1 Tax=Morchella importuna TaxID=1174673 RepID=UPI001E8CA336|nr:uncharacterized protein LAJ45_08066 [Morchella importuna]KAH8147965.1 hypothetical protein LAJ45_08066 [Morchella importuna]